MPQVKFAELPPRRAGDANQKSTTAQIDWPSKPSFYFKLCAPAGQADHISLLFYRQLDFLVLFCYSSRFPRNCFNLLCIDFDSNRRWREA